MLATTRYARLAEMNTERTNEKDGEGNSALQFVLFPFNTIE